MKCARCSKSHAATHEAWVTSERERQRRYRAANAAHVAALKKRYRAQNHEALLESERLYRISHRAECRQYDAQYRAKCAKLGCGRCGGPLSDPKKKWCAGCRVRDAKCHRTRNRERIREYGRTWALANRDRRRASCRQWRARDLEHARALGRAISRRRLARPEVAARGRAYSKVFGAKQRAQLGDGYVWRVLMRSGTSLRRTDVPRALIEAKRAQLLIHRLTRRKT